MRVFELFNGGEELIKVVYSLTKMPFSIYIDADRRPKVFDADSRAKITLKRDALFVDKFEEEIVQESDIDGPPPPFRLVLLDVISDGNAFGTDYAHFLGYLRESLNGGAVFCAKNVEVQFVLVLQLVDEGMQHRVKAMHPQWISVQPYNM